MRLFLLHFEKFIQLNVIAAAKQKIKIPIKKRSEGNEARLDSSLMS